MPKSKETSTLLEVLQRHPGQKSPQEMLDVTTPASTPPAQRAPQQSTGVVSQPVKPTPPRPAEALVRTEGRIIHFSLSTLMLAMIIFAFVLVVAAVFGIGWNLGNLTDSQQAEQPADRKTLDEPIRAARSQIPQPNVAKDLQSVNRRLQEEHARQNRRQQTDRIPWQDGLNYVWIETFNTYDETISAQTFLDGENIASAPIEKNGKWRLFTKQGFDYQIPEERTACQELIQRVKRLGLAYQQAGGRYRFDCLAKLKKPGESW